MPTGPSSAAQGSPLALVPNERWVPPIPSIRSPAVSEVPTAATHAINMPFLPPAPNAIGEGPSLVPSTIKPNQTWTGAVSEKPQIDHHRVSQVSAKPTTQNTAFSSTILPSPESSIMTKNKPIKIESFVPTPRHTQRPSTQTNLPDHTSESSSSAVLLSTLPGIPSSKALGKRKAHSELQEESPPRYREGSISTSVKRERERSSSLIDLKPHNPIPILPLPLPSKRFKKGPNAKALLIPVEQLPVFPLPPMPPINNPDLLKQVFTHQSLFERPKGRFEDPENDPIKHYEKLEHVGDSILGVIVTTWLHETKPNLTIGTATKLKAHLVSNATLSHLSGLYNLPQRLNGHPELLPVLRAQTDVRAALMEAYIAGLYFSFPLENRLGEGIKTIDNWLREMYEPLYDFFYNYMKKEFEQHHLTVGATSDGRSIYLENEDELKKVDEGAVGMSKLVECYCSSAERELRWQEEKIYTNQGLLWKTKCLVDGIELSEALRPFRRIAKNVAGLTAAKKLGLTVSQLRSAITWPRPLTFWES
ncbi:hypothetical protein I204_08183 [Kwoniella mangroviensis CBS 8886]|uniref:uncharacterized protein n=1 Tax=Kwoniella mangroviensis CBS 8507 TaxID=1296122 RepID=UPI00080CEA14|nr:hypothetical protein I204_08183 [Kwoniella mangroviensis CBS 8886]